MKVIGIAGKAGAGKDTAAALIKRELENKGNRVKIITFAEPIRNVAKALGLNPFDRDMKEQGVRIRFSHFEISLIEALVQELDEFVSEDDLGELYAHFVTTLRNSGYLVTNRQDVLTISPRRFCQLLGTEGGRAVREHFWVGVLNARVLKGAFTTDKYIVPDVRFLNECTPLHVLIAIDRPDISEVAEHSSEAYFGELYNRADIQIVNDGSLDDFRNTVIQLAEDLQ